jgi:hypothetical protein
VYLIRHFSRLQLLSTTNIVEPTSTQFFSRLRLLQFNDLPSFTRYKGLRGVFFVISNKRILLFLPIIFVCILAIQLYWEVPTKKEKTNANSVNRQTASINIENNLAYSLKKINTQQRLEQNEIEIGKDNSELDKNAVIDLNFLINSYFSINKNNDQTIFQKKNEEVRLRISQNQNLYNETLNLVLENSLLANNNKTSSQIFALAASLPLGPSSMQNSSEKLLIDLMSADREWDEELFKSALQFYYIQNLIKNEKNDTLIKTFITRCPDENLKQKILQIDKEINIYSKKEEADK